MRARLQKSRRPRGAVLVESAMVLPVLLTLLLASMVAGLGVYRYYEIAYLAREGSRWASVHGPQYETDNKVSIPTATDVLNNAVKPRMSGLDASKLTPTLTWNTSTIPATVTFRLDYVWVPEAFLPSATMTSTSTQLITY